MRIGGFIDASTKDWPKKAVAVIFTVGCNFNCKFCHNKPLLQLDAGEDLTIDAIIERIKDNFLVDSVSITGGEPTLQKDLLEVCKQLKSAGKLVSVDTNGSNPDVIGDILPFVDRIAMDIKGPIESDDARLTEIVNTNIESRKINESFNIVQKSAISEFEIRTTYVNKLHIPSDLKQILTYLKMKNFTGTYVIQQYQYSDGVGVEYKDIYEEPSLKEIVTILEDISDLPFDVFVRTREVGLKKIH